MIVVAIWGNFARPPAGAWMAAAVVGMAGFFIGDIALLVHMFSKRTAFYERINFPEHIRRKSDYDRIKKELEEKSKEEMRALPSGRSSHDDPNPYWMTGSYDPQRYYSYSKSERDLMRLFDMDADEWDANMG